MTADEAGPLHDWSVAAPRIQLRDCTRNLQYLVLKNVFEFFILGEKNYVNYEKNGTVSK